MELDEQRAVLRTGRIGKLRGVPLHFPLLLTIADALARRSIAYLCRLKLKLATHLKIGNRPFPFRAS
jgi:hypothetical protein